MADEKVKIDPSTTVPGIIDTDPIGELREPEPYQPHTGDYEIIDLLTDARTSLESMIDETTGGHGDVEDIEEGRTGALEALDKLEAASLFDILRERARQNVKWGGPSHDDQHILEDWLTEIKSRVNVLRLVSLTCDDAGVYIGDAQLGDFTLTIDASPEKVRKLLVQIAALALAAIESHDRLQKGVPAEQPNPAVYSREECPFHYCDDPSTCQSQNRCRHRPL